MLMCPSPNKVRRKEKINKKVLWAWLYWLCTLYYALADRSLVTPTPAVHLLAPHVAPTQPRRRRQIDSDSSHQSSWYQGISSSDQDVSYLSEFIRASLDGSRACRRRQSSVPSPSPNSLTQTSQNAITSSNTMGWRRVVSRLSTR